MAESPLQVDIQKTIDAQELYSSAIEQAIRSERLSLLDKCLVPHNDLLNNLGLFLNSKNMGRILFMHHIYQKILNVHGVVMDFGTRYGQNMSLFMTFRGLFEPYNRHRKVIGFDAFSGFPEGGIDDTSDNIEASFAHEGGLATPEGYPEYLTKVLALQEQDNPMSHVRRFELCVGDARITLPDYLERNPETIVALAYFDFDVYKPTATSLELLIKRLPKGAVVAFDELCDHDSPGETEALMQVCGIYSIRLQRLPFVSRVSYFVVGD